MKRFIFDLDCTLLTGNFKGEIAYFNDVFGKQSNKIIGHVFEFLDEYEHLYLNYDTKVLAEFLSKKSGLSFTEEIINGWINLDYFSNDVIEEGIIPLLEYLKTKNKSLIVLTNWFSQTQIRRLEEKGLLPYFDEVQAGDINLKPHPITYITACGPYHKEDCIIIGDNLEKDYLAPKKLGLNAVLYDKDEVYPKKIVKVKKLDEIKNMF